MSTDPAAIAKYFVVFNGQPQGPHSAARVMDLWKTGTLTNETLICEEGAAAWVTLKEFEPALRSVLPPVPAAGYAPVAPRAPAPHPQPQPVIVKTEGSKGLRLGTIVAALVLFFVPWLEVSCAGQKLMTQNGLQTVLNRASPADQLQALGEMGGKQDTYRINPNKNDGELGKEAGHSILAGAALVATVIALFAVLSASGRQLSGVLAAIALGCIGVQALIGFPLKSAATKMMDEAMKKEGMHSPAMPVGPGGDMAKAMFGNIMSVDFTPWFYVELVLLGVAAATGLTGGGAQRAVVIRT